MFRSIRWWWKRRPRRIVVDNGPLGNDKQGPQTCARRGINRKTGPLPGHHGAAAGLCGPEKHRHPCCARIFTSDHVRLEQTRLVDDQWVPTFAKRALSLFGRTEYEHWRDHRRGRRNKVAVFNELGESRSSRLRPARPEPDSQSRRAKVCRGNHSDFRTPGPQSRAI